MGVFTKQAVLAIIILLSIIGLASAVDCSSIGNAVCGNAPSSTTGFGAVEICGTCYTCGASDGVCPEDFYSDSNGLQGSCGNCPDPECTAFVEGHVYTDSGESVDSAHIWASYQTGGAEELVDLTKTDENGYYHINNSLRSGFAITLFARYVDLYTGLVYQSENQVETIIRGENYNFNFVVKEASCNSDCTRGTVPYCDQTCQGNNGCVYKEQTNYPLPRTMNEAEGKLVGTRIDLDTRVFPTYTEYDYFNACDGDIQTETRYQFHVDERSDSIAHLITRSTRVRYNGEPVDLVVSYWDKK